jgi:hypothetical protein
MPITAMVVLMRGMGVLLVYSGSIPERGAPHSCPSGQGRAPADRKKRMVKFETRREAAGSFVHLPAIQKFGQKASVTGVFQLK